MKVSKFLFWISSFLSVITLGISTYLRFFTSYNYVIDYVVSILLNIFAGAIILVATSLVDYFINRRKVLKGIMLEYQRFAGKFENLDYFKPRIINDDEKDNFSSSDIDNYQKYLDKENYNLLESILKQYIDISNTNLNGFWDLYDDLDFLFDVGHKKRRNIGKIYLIM